MGMPARAITRDFIASVNAVDKRGYIESYAAAKLATFACRPYTASTIFDEYLDIWEKPRHAVVEQLETDSGLVADNLLPLSALGDLQLPYVEELPYFITRSVHEYFPLVRGETTLAAKTLYLSDDWSGLHKGTLFFHRKTNLSSIYFALPDICWNLETGALFPSRLFPLEETYVRAAAVAAATSDDDSGPPPELVLTIYNSTLEVIGTLSWATPAGPFVSAGISIIEAILGATLGEGQSLAKNLEAMGRQIIAAIKNDLDVRDLKTQMNAVRTFADWLTRINKELSESQDVASFRNTVLQQGGALFELNQNINSNGSQSLFGIIDALKDDDDLSPVPEKSDGSYKSKARFDIAQTKLAILGYATSMYVLALKIKASYLARLAFAGYDSTGEPIPENTNPDTTINRLFDELPARVAALRVCGANFTKRRLAMIGERASACVVAYSRLELPVSMRYAWRLGDHDGLWTGSGADKRVRDSEDHPTVEEFEPYRYGVWLVPWQRHEIFDLGIDDGRKAQNFVVDNCHFGGWNYVKDAGRLDGHRSRHTESVRRSLDDVLKIPDLLTGSFETLLSRWTPQIPEKLPDGRPFIAAWHGRSLKDELWADSSVYVRYLFRLMGTTAQHPSVMSNDDNSTLWQKAIVEGEAKRKPEIKGIPISGQFMEYVASVLLFRQFKRGQKIGAPRLVATLVRDKDTGKFPTDCIVDEISTENDKPALLPEAGWLPQIPDQLSNRPAVEEWLGKPRYGDLWVEPEIEVRYLFSLVTSDKRESKISPDGASSEWTRAKGRSEPKITVPDNESFLEFATFIRVYRQFRKVGKSSKPRLVKTLERGEITGRFSASFSDTESTQDDILT
jgi:hypothetical protein